MSSQEKKKCIRCKVNLLLKDYKLKRDGNYTSYCIVCLDKNKKKRNKRKEINKDKFECKDCDKKFSTNDGLKNHIKQVHLKIKDFVCNECGYSCSFKGVLKEHIKMIHNKIKNFVCKDCDYSCSNNSDLRKHIKRCTGKEHIPSGEFKVRKCLQKMNINFQHNTSYVVKDKGWLEWDFIIYKDDKIQGFIEYDGKQHFIPVCYGGISKERAEENLKECQKRDKIKDDFCKENNYPLLRIPYTDFGNIPQIINDFCVEYLDWGYE